MSLKKNWSEAIKYYQRLIISQPKNHEIYLKLARTLQRQNHLLRKDSSLESAKNIIEINNHKSIVAYQKAITLQPKQPVWVYIALGDALNQSAQLDEAIFAYQKGFEIKPDSSEVCIKLARAFMSQKQVTKAIELYQKAISSKPQQSPRLYIDLGIALAQNEQFDDALNAYYTAIELEPKSKAFLNHWAGVYKKLYLQQNPIAIAPNDKLETITKIYHQATENYPEQAEGYFGIGHALLAEQNWNLAIEFLLEALKRNPNWHQAYTSLAYALKQQGNHNPEDIKLCYTKFIVPQWLSSKVYQFQDRDLVTSETTVNELLEYVEVETVEPSLDNELEKTFVITLKNGRAWRNLVNNDLPNNVVITSDNRIVKEVSTTHNSPLIFSAKNYIQPLKLDQTVAYLQGIGINNYYHWMLQVIPQFCLLRQVGIDLETIDKFAFLRLPTHLPFQNNTLNLLGIPDAKIVETSKHPLIQAKKLIVTSPIAGSPPRKLACDLVRDEFLKHRLPAREKRADFIYLSRKNAIYRRILNEEELIALLDSFGFTSFCLETLSLLEQIDLFSQAKVIVAPHGAALTNLIFCNPGVKVIEIFAPSYHMTCYEDICDYYQLPYYSLVAEGIVNPKCRRKYDRDINVNLNSLIELMKLANII